MSTTHDALKERLRRLLSVTVENGATEAEAMVAAAKASEMMAAHNLSYRSVEEIEAEAYDDDTRAWFRGAKGRSRSAPVPPAARCLAAICDLCNVEHLFNTYSGTLTFFGAKHDTEVAHYLTIIISRAMEREWASYRRQRPPGMAARERASFFYGISCRIASRLMAMAEEQAAAATSSTPAGTSLVLVKNALVKQRFEEKHARVKPHGVNTKPASLDAVRSGWASGEKVSINKAINEASGAKLLTSEPTP